MKTRHARWWIVGTVLLALVVAVFTSGSFAWLVREDLGFRPGNYAGAAVFTLGGYLVIAVATALPLAELAADEQSRTPALILSILALAPPVQLIGSTWLAADSGYSSEGPAWADVMLVPTILLAAQALIIVGSAAMHAVRASERRPIIWMSAAAIGVGVIAAVVEAGLIPTVVLSTGLVVSATVAAFARRTFPSTSNR